MFYSLKPFPRFCSEFLDFQLEHALVLLSYFAYACMPGCIMLIKQEHLEPFLWGQPRTRANPTTTAIPPTRAMPLQVPGHGTHRIHPPPSMMSANSLLIGLECCCAHTLKITRRKLVLSGDEHHFGHTK